VQVRLRWTIRLKKWAAKAAKTAVRYVGAVLFSIMMMIVAMDGLGLYFAQQTATEIATRAAVAASQTLRQGSDRESAEREALAQTERSLATFKGIQFRGSEVEVTVVYKARSIAFKHIPGMRKFLTITASGRYSSLMKQKASAH